MAGTQPGNEIGAADAGKSNVVQVDVEEPETDAANRGGQMNYVLPLESLVFRVPEVKDPEILECVRQTLNECFQDLTWDIAFQAASECDCDWRKVITEEDMERTLDRIASGQTDADTSLRARLEVVRERNSRDAKLYHPYGRATKDGEPSVPKEVQAEDEAQQGPDLATGQK